MKEPRHPIQPVFLDDSGVARFKKNKIVEFLLDSGAAIGIDMNKLAIMDFSREDREQFAQLIGYSVAGASELSYVSDEVIAAATEQTQRLLKRKRK